MISCWMRLTTLALAVAFWLPAPGWALPRFGGGNTPDPDPPVAANTAALESQYVAFSPAIPLRLGSANMVGYETRGSVLSDPILSPRRDQMALSQIMFISGTRQTVSRIFLLPVGEPPDDVDILPLSALDGRDRRAARAAMGKKNPGAPVTARRSAVNPRPYWDRYDPRRQWADRVPLLEKGSGITDPYRVDILQVADWSADSRRLLAVYRPGRHHLGLLRTVPVVIDLESRRPNELIHVPTVLWQATAARGVPETRGGRVWDIRPLGWVAGSSTAFIAKVVVFEGQSEVPVATWSYDVVSGAMNYLGVSPPAGRVAHNGWTVRFRRYAPDGTLETYAPTDAPTAETLRGTEQQQRTAGKWWNRLYNRQERGGGFAGDSAGTDLQNSGGGNGSGGSPDPGYYGSGGTGGSTTSSGTQGQAGQYGGGSTAPGGSGNGSATSTLGSGGSGQSSSGSDSGSSYSGGATNSGDTGSGGLDSSSGPSP